MATATVKKDLSIETLRGMAIILVVVGHVIGSKSDGGMKVDDDSFLRHLYFTFCYLRMPLFTVISGWVYAIRPVSAASQASFMFKKSRRLLLPLIFVGGAFWVVQSVVPGTNMSLELSSIWRLLVFPFNIYWYLPALFWVFLIVSFIDVFRLAHRFNHWIILLLVSTALLVFRDAMIPKTVENYFAFKMVIYLLPFFLFGIGINRFNEIIYRSKTILWIVGVIFFLCIVSQQLVWYKLVPEGYMLHPAGLMIGFTGAILLFNMKIKIRWLIWLGSFAYTIFLFHTFGTAGGRIFLKVIGINHDVPIFFASLIMGFIVPIIADYILIRFKLTRMLLLGLSYRKPARRKSFKDIIPDSTIRDNSKLN